MLEPKEKHVIETPWSYLNEAELHLNNINQKKGVWSCNITKLKIKNLIYWNKDLWQSQIKKLRRNYQTYLPNAPMVQGRTFIILWVATKMDLWQYYIRISRFNSRFVN